jgi:hypothetical protein
MKTLLTVLLAFLCLNCYAQSKFEVPQKTIAFISRSAVSGIASNLNKGDTITVLDYKSGYWKIHFKNKEMYAFEPSWNSPQLDLIKRSNINSDNSGHQSNETREEHFKHVTLAKGISEEDVIHIYGEPTKRNVTTYSFGTHEQWIYESSSSLIKYVYLENGKVTAWEY